MAEDNLSRQIDEVEALSSIYGDEWCVVDETIRTYCIQIRDNPDNSSWTLCLQVMLPVGYPSDDPPVYQLNAPWLRGDERRLLSNSLEDVYCENLGESIIYLWVEKIRDFLLEKSTEGNNECVGGGRVVNVSEETDDSYSEDGYDPAEVVAADIHTSIQDLNISSTDESIECPEISHGGTLLDRRSIFQAHLAPISHKQQVKMVLDKLCENKKIANATHNIVAYRICTSKDGASPVFYQGCVDDGEIHAGSRMLHLMHIVDAQNVIVVVSRWYGGIHLGPDRFKHINNCTREILEKHGYIKEKEGKKGPKSSRRSR